ncbi:prepilin-type N-terminal cleavage/methylation domain-containing protein [Clostridium frigoris]|uniref:Prepilin-type N-terminal cleavage/methylation domain-containing protein n=1 Tax=Clostridium frigoris TaxID=205327 RepID=A0ABS6BU34_9CLOT|nr:prepilin-type N-terminal cleavage/methylation domain-containing protein [Clostridium frigoris]MBU3160430.1 prepilin-type N-terminal cleavage/methylation domain-containing protein [Clostridium frigoris]
MEKIIQSKKKGFTLIELIIVIAIIAILAAIAVPNFIALRNRSANNADLQSCQTIKKAVEVMVADNTISVTVVSDYTVTGFNPAVVTTGTGGTTAGHDGIVDALSNVRAPQGHGMLATVDLNNPNAVKYGSTMATGYKITISAAGVVQVFTTPTPTS